MWGIFYFFFEIPLLHVSRSDMHLWVEIETRSPLERGSMRTDLSGERDCPPAPLPCDTSHGVNKQHDWSFVVWFALVRRTSFGWEKWSCVETNRFCIYFNIPGSQKKKKESVKDIERFPRWKKMTKTKVDLRLQLFCARWYILYLWCDCVLIDCVPSCCPSVFPLWLFSENRTKGS